MEDNSVANLPVECSNLTYLTLQIRITAKKQTWGLYSNNPTPQKVATTTEQNKSLLNIQGSSDPRNTNQTPINGIIAQVSESISPTRWQTPETRGTMIL